MFTVTINEIPDGGLEWTEELGIQWLEPLIAPRFEPDGKPVRLKISLKCTDRNVVMNGDLSGRLDFVCSRCAETKSLGLDHSFVRVFVPRAQNSALPADLGNPELTDFTFYDGTQIELEPVAAEELVLALPLFPLCSAECKGLCVHCGRNLNNDPCDCRMDVVDPRWQKLKEIKL